MKYKKLGFVAAFCLVCWFILVFVIFNESSARNVQIQTSKDTLLKYIQDLEKQIQEQQQAYQVLTNKLGDLKQYPKVSGSSLEELRSLLSSLGISIPTVKPSHEGNENVSVDEEIEDEVEPVEGQRLEGKQPTKEKSNINNEAISRKEEQVVLPILVFSCNRPSAVSRSLSNLLKYRPNPVKFPIIVSQDCGHEPTAAVIQSFSDQVKHLKQPDQSEPVVPPNEQKFKGYFKIARHYRWALQQVFRTFNHSAVIIVEDDLDVAPDFFEYFSATHDLLLKDPTLWCVSAWNDNGKLNLVDTKHSELLYRSDFFPGLGWMITKKIWDELEPKWPKSYWDDWMRLPEQRRNRACVRPEVSRTRTFGKIGVSNGMFFDKHLKFIKLNEESITFSRLDLTYLLQSNYDKQFLTHVYSVPVVTAADVKTNQLPDEAADGPIRITYHSKDSFRNAAKLLGLMEDFKSGVPRTGYRGIVTFFYNGRRVYLAPNANWKGYDLSWS